MLKYLEYEEIRLHVLIVIKILILSVQKYFIFKITKYCQLVDNHSCSAERRQTLSLECVYDLNKLLKMLI